LIKKTRKRRSGNTIQIDDATLQAQNNCDRDAKINAETNAEPILQNRRRRSAGLCKKDNSGKNAEPQLKKLRRASAVDVEPEGGISKANAEKNAEPPAKRLRRRSAVGIKIEEQGEEFSGVGTRRGGRRSTAAVKQEEGGQQPEVRDSLGESIKKGRKSRAVPVQVEDEPEDSEEPLFKKTKPVRAEAESLPELPGFVPFKSEFPAHTSQV
jgi:hypothetical protein